MGKVLLKRKRGERGQSFMELAVSLVFLLVLLMVVIDLGWAFYEMIALRDAAQEAASYGAMCPINTNSNIERRLRLSASTPLNMDDIEPSDILIEIIDPATGSPAAIALGNAIRVTVTIHHDIMVPFVGTFIGRNDYPLTVTVTDTIMRIDCR